MLPLSSKGGSASSASNSMVSSIVSPAPSLHRSLGQNLTTFVTYSLGRDRTLAPSGYNRLLSVRRNSAGNASSALPQFGSTPFGALACFGPVANFKLRVAYFGRYPPLAPVELRSVVALGGQGHPVSGCADSRFTATIVFPRRAKRGDRYCEGVQCEQGIWIYSTRQGRQGRVCAHLGRGKSRPE